MIRNAPALKFYSRNDRLKRATVPPSTTMLPRETFDGNDELLAAYDTMTTLNAAIRDNAALAESKRREAADAETQHKIDVAAAMAAGKDPAKVNNRGAKLIAEAEAHEEYAAEARLEAARHGHVLGDLMQRHAPHAFAASESRMDAQATAVESAVAGLESAWAEWATAWEVRRRLSGLHILGGVVSGFRQGVVPAEVQTALNSLRQHLAELDALKADEAEIQRWREQDARAAAINNNLRPGVRSDA